MPEGYEEGRCWIGIHGNVMIVGDDPHNLECCLIRNTDAHAPADWVFVAEPQTRQSFIDDDNRRTGGGIAFGEGSAVDQTHA